MKRYRQVIIHKYLLYEEWTVPDKVRGAYLVENGIEVLNKL